MWNLTYPWWEIILRATCIFISIFVIFRFIGKKQLGEMSPFDFVLLLIISESVNGGLIGDDNSLPGGILSAFTLISLSYLIDVLAFKSKKFEGLVEGHPQFIIVNGKTCEEVRKKEKITMNELKNALREEGLEELDQVKYALLETNGRITIVKKTN